MINKAYALQFKTRSGNCFFCGFAEGESIKTAWTLAEAELFTSEDSILAVLKRFKVQEKKKCVIVKVVVAHQVASFNWCPL